MLNGDCSLSGVENKARNMIDKGESAQDVAKFVLTYIAETVSSMLGGVVQKYGDLPVVFSGGVASNSCFAKLLTKDITHILPKVNFLSTMPQALGNLCVI